MFDMYSACTSSDGSYTAVLSVSTAVSIRYQMSRSLLSVCTVLDTGANRIDDTQGWCRGSAETRYSKSAM